MNKENFQLVLDKINSCPDQWKQDSWHCGTQHCFGGWAQILSGKPADDNKVRHDARIFLDLTKFEADYLFAGSRTLSNFNAFLSKPYDLDGYDRDGYGRDGYDRNGYDRDGYDRDGYDRYGYDRGGYDRYGYGRYGYDRGGYDRYGYGRDGYGRDGYGRNGYDRDGYDRDGYDRDQLDKNNQPKPPIV